MLAIAIVMILILVFAGLVLVYVAYPHRGEEVPAASWLGEAMERAVEAAPTLGGEDDGRSADGVRWFGSQDARDTADRRASAD